MTYKIATWNVNSVRARIESVLKWIEEENPTVVMLQEIKCQTEVFPYEAFESLGYNCLVKGQKSYNGVAILSKEPITLETDILCNADGDDCGDVESRYIEATLNIGDKLLRVASVYVPNGSSTLVGKTKLEESPRFLYKMNFFDRLHSRMKNLLENNKDEYIIFGGDYNVAMRDIDLYNPDSARGGVGFHPLEVEKMDSIIDNAGYVDLFRLQNPDQEEYSWWDYRRGGWQGNKGWRIDYMMTSPNVISKAECLIHKHTRAHEKPSDHAPVVVKINL